MKFTVAVPKDYFPKELWPAGVEEFIQTHEITAKDRESAATKVWEEFGKLLLAQMTKRRSPLPRKVSLFVSGPKGTSARHRLVNWR